MSFNALIGVTSAVASYYNLHMRSPAQRLVILGHYYPPNGGLWPASSNANRHAYDRGNHKDPTDINRCPRSHVNLQADREPNAGPESCAARTYAPANHHTGSYGYDYRCCQTNYHCNSNLDSYTCTNGNSCGSPADTDGHSHPAIPTPA